MCYMLTQIISSRRASAQRWACGRPVGGKGGWEGLAPQEAPMCKWSCTLKQHPVTIRVTEAGWAGGESMLSMSHET